MNETIVKIKPSVILWGIGIIFTLMVLVALKDIVIILFLAFIISSGFRPIVDKLAALKVPRMMSLILIYLSVTLITIVVLLLTIDTFITQFNTITSNLPGIVENILRSISNVAPQEWGLFSESDISEIVKELDKATSVDARTLQDIFNFLGRNFKSISDTGLNLLGSVTNAVFSIFLVLMIAAYLIARPEKAYRGLIGYIPKKNQETIMHLFDQVEQQLGVWLVGQLILMLIIGLVTYVAIMIPHLFGVTGYELHKFALLIAIIAGFLEAFPNIGPTLTLIVTMLMALGTGGSFGVLLYIFIAFTMIQQLENVFIVPLVIGKAVNLDPIIIIVAIAAGLQLGGVLGAVLSIPVTVIVRIIVDEVNNQRIESEKLENKRKSNEQTLQSNVSRKTFGQRIEGVKDLIGKLF
ncbi:AI-2E family transporter [Candidatus Dojkabacteria bacterium]|uniref:AI-2E family transporter n=1 Tax=Candidatus Dojkabacteria bacterium TaxID=2099670 RepID=A0A955RLI7_9BACT|nr:AI-2E family transporter [Candidatus Dojkabacteria bacterium]